MSCKGNLRLPSVKGPKRTYFMAVKKTDFLKDDAFIITVLKRNRQGSKLLFEKGIICQ